VLICGEFLSVFSVVSVVKSSLRVFRRPNTHWSRQQNPKTTKILTTVPTTTYIFPPPEISQKPDKTRTFAPIVEGVVLPLGLSACFFFEAHGS
jgi:hypothetical protein